MKILKTIQKVPGGLMVVPLFLGAIVNLVFPQFLDLGGMTTATFKSGASAFIGASLMCVGSQITVTRVGEPLKRGAVLLIAKFLAGFVPTVIANMIWGPAGVLGITPLMLLAAVTNSNGGMYLGLMTNFGDENDLGAQSLLGINDGPFLTLLGLGLAGVTSFDWKSLLASVVPLIVGIILGNLDKDIRKFLQPGIMFTLPFLAFCLGTGLNLRNIVTGGAIGTRRTPLTWKSTLNAAPPLSSPTRFLTITSLTRQTYRRTQTMRKRSAEEKQKQLERFLMNVAEAADAALWEYWREKEAEHRRFATEYVTRRGLIPQQ